MRHIQTLPLLLAAATQTYAQEQERPEADFELVTTAIHVRRSETALPVTVLSGEELRDAARATLGDTLAGEPGINNASFGPAVGQTVIRGQQGRRVMNLTNSIPNGDAAGNSADHALAVEPILANSIEVLRGPSTLLYGGGAIGGVVNVIDNRVPTQMPARPSLALETRHDTAADQDTAVARLDFAGGGLAWHLDALYRGWNDLDIPGFATAPAWFEDEHHDEAPGGGHELDEGAPGMEEQRENSFGFIPNTGGETRNLTAGTSWVFDTGYLGLAVSRLENNYGLPPGSHAHEEEGEHAGEDHAAEAALHGAGQVDIDMRRTRYDLAGQWSDLGGFWEDLHYRLSHIDYAHSEVEGASTGTRYTNDSWQQRLQLTHRALGGWHGVLGWQSAYEEFGAFGAESFIPLTRIRGNGLFLVEDIHAGDLTLELGARINRDARAPLHGAAPSRDFTTFSLSASGLWDISAPLSLGLTWSRSQRPPSVEELYSNVGLADLDDCVIHFATAACEIGATGFEAETSANTDLSLYLDFTSFSATLTAFHNHFSDYIHQRNSGMEVGEFPVRYYTQGDATFSGLEVDTTFSLTPWLQLRLFGDMIRGRLDDHGAAPRMPPGRLGSRLDWRGERWSAWVSVLRAAQQDDAGRNEEPTAGYTRWDIGADYRLDSFAGGRLLLFVKGRNLGNEEIRLATSWLRGHAPEAGRSLEAGLRYRF